MRMVLEERDLWEVTCGAIKLEHSGPDDLQEEVSQGVGDHLSRDGRFAVAAGPVGE
ncbi:hypothetical protein DVH05_020056 [Phytophthora capsici]|nr:hypothetical protein DVH05_020056 [Phytophthora capsici]